MNKKGYTSSPWLGVMLCVLAANTFSDALFEKTSLEKTLQPQLTYQQAIELAKSQDVWLERSQWVETQHRARSDAADALPNPSLSLSAMNLPVDSFDTSQEAMTQLQLGVTQAIPRGKTRALKQKKFNLKANTQPYLRMDRLGQIELTVGSLWLEAYRNKKTMSLIKRNRVHFEDLVEVVELNYSNALRNVKQQDIVRAKLELTRLDDRLIQLEQSYQNRLAQLSEWIPLMNKGVADTLTELSSPELSLTASELIDIESHKTLNSRLISELQRHPALLSLDRDIDISKNEVALAEQAFEPMWKIKAGYGHRMDDPMGNARSDLFSIGVSVDFPLFSRQQTQQQVKAAKAETESRKIDKTLKLKSMVASFLRFKSTWKQLLARKSLYSNQFLNQTEEQADAAVTAYTNDEGSFSEVVTARIQQINAEIQVVDIDIQVLKTTLNLNYLALRVEPNQELQGMDQ